MDKLEFISSLKWYFEVKNLCLKSAIVVRCPLSVHQQKDLRLYYSQYFSGLLAATEMFLEKEYINNDKFKLQLETAMCFDGYPDGKKNYCYIKELRNSIIHRGLDITAQAEIQGDFPMHVAPQLIKNRNGNETYHAFDRYLLGVISKCESTIPKVIGMHLEEVGLLQASISEAERVDMAEKHKQLVNNSDVMPDWVKNGILSSYTPDFVELHKSLIENLIIELEHNVMNSFRIESGTN